MELRVNLKVCEACGCLWYRTQLETRVYCSTCLERLKEFPSPQSRKRRGRPRKVSLPTVWAVAATSEHNALNEDPELLWPLSHAAIALITGTGAAACAGGAQ